MNAFKAWEKTEGQKIMSIIGIKAGDTVLDFGCGKGYYSFAVSPVVGEYGTVIALDKSRVRIKMIQKRCAREGIDNIKCVSTDGSLKLPIADDSVDAVLLYDIIHHFKEVKREALLTEMRRIMKPEAILSVQPSHEFNDENASEDLILELVLFGFEHMGNIKTRLIHFRRFEEGAIYNFNVIK